METYSLEAILKLNTEEAQKKINALTKTVDANTSGGAGGAGNAAIGGLIGGAVAGAVMAAIPTLLNFLSDAFKTFLQMLGRIVSLLSLILKPIDLLLTSILMPLFYMLAPLIRILNRLLMPFIRAYMKQIRERKSQLETFGPVMFPMIMTEAFVSGMTALFEPVMDLFIDLAYTAASVLLPVLQQTTGLIADIADAFFSLFGIETHFSDFVDEMFEGLIENLPTIRDFIKAEIDIIANKIEVLPDSIQTAINKMEESGGIAATVASAMNSIDAAVSLTFGAENGTVMKTIHSAFDTLTTQTFPDLADKVQTTLEGMSEDTATRIAEVREKMQGLIADLKTLTNTLSALLTAVNAITGPIREFVEALNSFFRRNKLNTANLIEQQLANAKVTIPPGGYNQQPTFQLPTTGTGTNQFSMPSGFGVNQDNRVTVNLNNAQLNDTRNIVTLAKEIAYEQEWNRQGA